MQETETADWPERFVYVCSAGGAANVNIVPMLRAGRDRVAAVVILVGLANRNKPNASDKRHALDPADRIRTFASTALGLEKDQIKIVLGHSDLITDWNNASDEIADFVQAHGGVAVFNLTGGRVASKIGGMLGLMGRPEIHVQYLTVGLDDFTVRLVGPQASGGFREVPLPVTNGVDLATYLGTFGIAEQDEAARRGRERAFADAIRTTRQLDSALDDPLFVDAQKELLRALPIPEKKDVKPPISLQLNHAHLPVLQSAFGGTPGVEWTNGELFIRSKHALEFLQGKWLEALAYNRACDAFRGSNSVKVAAAVEIARGKDAPPDATETDIDLVLLGNDQLSLIECKAIVNPKGQLRKGIDTIAVRRDELVGPGGKAFLVAPLLSARQIQRGRYFEQARARNVRLLCGPDAINQLIKDLEGFYGRRP